MKINIIAVGKLQSDYKALFASYIKRIEFHVDVKVTEIKEVNEDNPLVQMEKETKLILATIPKHSHVYLCSLQGKEYSSEKFAELLAEDNLTFVIGGSHGVNEKLFDDKISFSKLTFPHQLFRVMLAEQIFRGFSILHNSKYHK